MQTEPEIILREFTTPQEIKKHKVYLMAKKIIKLCNHRMINTIPELEELIKQYENDNAAL